MHTQIFPETNNLFLKQLNRRYKNQDIGFRNEQYFPLDNYRELNIVCLVGESEGISWLGGNGWRFFMIGGGVWKCILVV